MIVQGADVEDESHFVRHRSRLVLGARAGRCERADG